jgi:uncharacterized damage-inducible protein DinB
MQDWRAIVASSLGWEQAHLSLEKALAGLTPEQRGRVPENYPHSIWQLVEHIRIAQHDLLDFCVNENYSHDIKWPDDYWPASPAPGDDDAWDRSLDQIRRDRQALENFAVSSGVDLTGRIPHGTGQTYLRTILVAMDHNAYHLGQIVDVRRLIGAWPA